MDFRCRSAVCRCFKELAWALAGDITVHAKTAFWTLLAALYTKLKMVGKTRAIRKRHTYFDMALPTIST